MPSFAPKIRVEVYVPIRYEPAYQDTLTWLIEEFTELRGGCTRTRKAVSVGEVPSATCKGAESTRQYSPVTSPAR